MVIELIKEKFKEPFFLFMHFDNTHFPYPTVPNPKPSGKNNKRKVLRSIKSKSQREYVKKRFRPKPGRS